MKRDSAQGIKKDLGTGSVKKLLASLAVPSLVGQVVNLLYNIVDRIYIGHIPDIGAPALTGVGLFTPILMLITAFAMLSGAGGAPLAAIAMGEGKKDRAEKIMGNCLSLMLGLSVLLTVALWIFIPDLIRLFGGSESTVPYGATYGRIYVLGSVFIMIVMGMNPFITTQGFAKVSMLTTVIGAVINIVLDPIFIFVLNMGVAGAAVATVLSQAVGAVWILRFLTGKKTAIRIRVPHLRPVGKIIASCLGLGISTFVMVSTESILSISFTTSLAGYGGDLAVGAMTVMTSLMQLISMPMTGLCQGGQPLMSYNYGAGKMDRAREAFRCQFILAVGYSFLFWLLVRLLPGTLAGIFTDSPELVDYTVRAMGVFMAVCFTHGFQTSCQQAFVAFGQAKISLFLACLRKLILLIPLIFILPGFMEDKVTAVFLAEPVSDFLAAVTTTCCFFRFYMKKLKTGK